MNMLRRVVCLILVVLLSLPLSAAFAEIFDAADETDIYAVDDLRTITDYPILKRGDRDGDDAAAYIVMLQNRLIELGFLEDEADGIYGEDRTRNSHPDPEGGEGNGQLCDSLLPQREDDREGCRRDRECICGASGMGL